MHSQKVIFSTEEGTLWWHAHSDWSRATVYGAIVIYPRLGTTYPFTQPYQEVPIILGRDTHECTSVLVMFSILDGLLLHVLSCHRRMVEDRCEESTKGGTFEWTQPKNI